MGWNEKTGLKNKHFQKGGMLCEGVGALKKRVVTPLRVK